MAFLHPSYLADLDMLALQRLSLKWESKVESCHDYRFFLKRSLDDTLLASSTSK